MTSPEPLRDHAVLADVEQKATPRIESEPANGTTCIGAGDPQLDVQPEIGDAGEPPVEIQFDSQQELKEAQADNAATPKTSARRRSKKERMESSHPEILDVEGAAKVMGVGRWLVLRLAREGKIPGKKVGKEWRFKLSNLLRWVGEPEMVPIDPSTPEGIRQLLNNPRTKFRPGGFTGG